MSKSFFSMALLILASSIGYSQQLTGTVSDAIDGEPLVGASVILDDSVSFTITDPDGEYSFSKVNPGRHVISVSYVGYKYGKVYDVWVKNGKITTTDISLTRDFTGLQEVVITEPKGLNEIGKMTISEEQINRFAATYYDPARLVTISPDVAVSNDQNNRISVRGISPNYNVWRLEDVEIVNPNHLSNAGTFSDQPTSTGGGVNILSAQMLDNSDFLYSGFNATYGNSVGGIFDMRLKTGNKDERQYTAQASLIGFDFSAEGPFSKNGDASYIVNYRYSFTGLLTSMGVDFGGESIGFQDLSFNVNKPLGEKGNISFFGVGGLNFNNFNAKTFEESEVQKDRSDIYYDGRMGALGMKLNYQVGPGTLMLSGAISSSQNDRNQNLYNPNQTISRTDMSSSDNQIISSNLRYNFKIDKGSVIFGCMTNLYENSHLIFSTRTRGTSYKQLYINPFINVYYPITSRMHLDFGVNYNYQVSFDQNSSSFQNGYQVLLNVNSNNSAAFDPRMKLTFDVDHNLKVYTLIGKYSQILNNSNYFFVFNGSGGDFTEEYGPFEILSSGRAIIGFQNSIRDKITLSGEGFLYYFPGVNIGTNFGTYNGRSQEDALSYGFSLMINRPFIGSWYFSLGGSIFNSIWDLDIPDKSNQNRFNLKGTANVTLGKEWNFIKEFKKTISVNLNGIYQGGLKEPFPGNIYSIPTFTTTMNDPYYRADIRIQWTKYRKNRTTSWTLDIQNATSRKNDAYQYYDEFAEMFIQQKQLGLIPILAYRIEF